MTIPLLSALDALFSWNITAFQAVNQGLANPVFDLVMPIFRNPWTWGPVYTFFLVFLIHNFKKQGLLICGLAIVGFLMSDQISAHLLKPLIQFPRPCHAGVEIPGLRLLVPCGSGYSLPSAHATNHFAFSVLISSILSGRVRWIWPITLTWAALVSFAQVYVGVHFPVDVILGAILGTIIALLIANLGKLYLDLDQVQLATVTTAQVPAPQEQEAVVSEQ